jgi:hypothetical protein
MRIVIPPALTKEGSEPDFWLTRDLLSTAGPPYRCPSAVISPTDTVVSANGAPGLSPLI